MAFFQQDQGMGDRHRTSIEGQCHTKTLKMRMSDKISTGAKVQPKNADRFYRVRGRQQ